MRYALDDPRLQAEMGQLAAEEAAAWPVTDTTLAKLARILPAAEAMAVRKAAHNRTQRVPQRRAA